MFSKALYKQSWKANWVIWLATTVVSVFVLVIIMSLIGGEGMGKLTSTFTETIVEENLKSNFENASLNYYTLTEDTLEDFDLLFIDNFVLELKENPFTEPNEATFTNTFFKTIAITNEQMLDKLKETHPNITIDSDLYIELSSAIMLVFSEDIMESNYDVYSLVSHLDAEDYIEIWTTDNIPNNLYEGLDSESRNLYRLSRAKKSSSSFLAISMTDDEAINKIIDSLSVYNINREIYDSFGFDYDNLTYIGNTAILTYQARIAYEIETNKDLTEEEIKLNLKANISSNFLNELPEELTNILEEFDQEDMYTGTLVSIYYKIVGMLIVIIYIIMVSVNLISGQVDSGSMAYILSTGTKRRQVTNTQTLFLVTSVFFSFVVTTITSLIVFHFATPVQSEMTYLKLIFFGFGTFLIAFAFSGINFLTSAIFNRSRQAMAIGGGVTILMLIFTILGMFGGESMPSMMRLDALNIFNNFSLITLLDEKAILSGNLTLLINFGILVSIGIVSFIVAGRVFKNKDLPL